MDKPTSNIGKINFANALTCILLLISYFVFVYVCFGGGEYCMNNFIKRVLRMLYNFDSSKVIWRCLDELITFLFQFRALRITKNPVVAVSISVPLVPQ
uniref:Uncharacterized protein n=1 Tax=Acrobeloides nanus TaxID=290746 RepID=A0A914CFR5_9BILA